MDISIVTEFLQSALAELQIREPMELIYGSAALIAAALLLMFASRRRARRKSRRLAAKAETGATAKAAPAASEDDTLEEDALPAPKPTVRPARGGQLKLASSATPVALNTAGQTGGLADLGVYTPHFDLSDSDAVRDAIKDVRAKQAEVATAAGIVIATEDQSEDAAVDAGAQAAERLAARAFAADSDAAIATVRWNTIEQMEERLTKTQSNIDATLAAHGRQVNPEFAELKLQELRLTHEQREKQKEEKDLRADLARLRKEEAQLVKDAKLAEKDEAQLQMQLNKAKQAVQKASGEAVFELEAQAGDLARQLEDAHQKTLRAQEMVKISTAGHLYVVSNVGAFGEGVFKIGSTRRPDPTTFVDDLSVSSVPFPFDVHALVYDEDADALRDRVYAALDGKRMNRTGGNNGFFTVSLDQITAVLREEAPQAEVNSLAEAQGYHQTLAQLRASKSGAA